MPKIEFKSNAKPSTFAYPPPLEEKSTKTKEKVETAVLSITAKQKKKDAEKQKDEKMEVVSLVPLGKGFWQYINIVAIEHWTSWYLKCEFCNTILQSDKVNISIR